MLYIVPALKKESRYKESAKRMQFCPKKGGELPDHPLVWKSLGNFYPSDRTPIIKAPQKSAENVNLLSTWRCKSTYWTHHLHFTSLFITNKFVANIAFLSNRTSKNMHSKYTHHSQIIHSLIYTRAIVIKKKNTRHVSYKEKVCCNLYVQNRSANYWHKKGHFFTTTKGMEMLRGEKKIRIQSNSN